MSANPKLQEMIDEARRERFTPEYQERATDGECLGLIIASHFSWDGLAIMEAAVSALEDANFHTEAGIVQDLLDTERAKG